MGRVILRNAQDADVRSKDGYVTVEWELTKRKGRYRWDYRRKFDVMPVKRVRKANSGSDEGVGSTTAPDSEEEGGSKKGDAPGSTGEGTGTESAAVVEPK